MTAMQLAKVGGAAAGAALVSFAAYSGCAWARYGHVHLERRPSDPLLDRFLPDPEVDEYHQHTIHAPAPVTFAVAKQQDFQASPLIGGIFWLREVPALLRGRPYRREGPRSFLELLLAGGWGVLAEDPDREIVVGCYTQPWQGEVRFRSLPPAEFAAFREPGYVKIAWTLAAEPLDCPDRSIFITRTRAVATDREARRNFRRYWAPTSAGIILIRYLILAQVKKEAERRARASAADATS